MWRLRYLLFPLLAMTSLLASSMACAKPCDPGRAYVLVQVAANRLSLCDHGRIVAQYRAAMGRGGAGKTRMNDRKTPLGEYPLGAPRPSRAGFHTFIPVLYPTDDQRLEGYTGGAVGIHGPKRGFKPYGRGKIINWTQGCVAVGSDQEIVDIAKWIEDNRILTVSIAR